MSIISILFHNSMPPKVGQKIQVTWLPYNNGYPNKNVYIGCKGIVTDVVREGGFCLDLGGAILAVTGEYRWKKIK